ncbi:MAG: iron-siderophore ABC transporter substrate-binding protein [Dehalococcoidia bacterium]|nr:iron-siderophore ABC transporter substrate-binding protein [Dehalococcoidia bacterium]
MTRRTISRRHILAAIPGALAIAGGVSCSGDDDDESTPTAAATTGTATTAATGTATASATATATAQALRLVPLAPKELGAPDAPAAAVSTAANPSPAGPIISQYAAFGTTAAPGVFPRTITHATGTTELKTKPVRVLPIDSGELDSVVQLGLKPIGYLDYNAALMPPHLVEALKDVKTVGTLAEPNIEAIAALKPDVVLTTKVRHEKIADTLKAVAPTIFGVTTGVAWKYNFALHAQALGRESEADATVRAYEDRIKKLNAALPKTRPTVSVIRVLNNNIRYYQRANYSGTILADLGFPRNASQNVDDFALLNQSLETLGQHADADLIIVSPTEGPEGAFYKQMLESPLWKNLNAVKNGNVLVVLDDVWMAGIGYRSAGIILDDIAKHFKV